MKVIEAVELNEIVVPIESVLNADGSFYINESVRSYFDIDYRPSSPVLRLVAAGRIGLIPLNDSVCIDIKPKFSISNLAHILSGSGSDLAALDFFTRQYQEVADQSPSLFLFFLKSLDKGFQEVAEEGVYRAYKKRRSELSSIKGRVDTKNTLLRNWAKGNYAKVHVDFFDFTEDNPLNQLLKLALWVSINKLITVKPNETALRDSLIEHFDILDKVTLDLNATFLPVVNSMLSQQKIPVLRNYYINLCNLCKFIIDSVGIDLTSAYGNVSLLSHCIDMAETFERYILNVIRSGVNEIDDSVVVEDGNNEGMKPFFLNRPTPVAKPDYIVKKDGLTRIIIDSKYKLKLKEVDRYQILSHCLSYGADVAVLLSPCRDGKSPGLLYYGEVGSGSTIKLYEYNFDLGAACLVSEEKALLKALSTITV